MDSIKKKFKLWLELIESEELESAMKDLQMNIRVQPDNKLNKYIFKLLLCLSCTAHKCKAQNHMTGKRIAELAKLLCSLLIEIPDDKAYISSLYHIIRCLICLNLYEDAADICCYLQPGDLYSPKDETMKLLVKIVYLWRIPINNIYSLASEALSTANYNNLKNIIRHEIQIIQIAYKNYTQHLIVRISTHIDKIATIDKGNNIYFDDFCKYILEYLIKVQLCLDKDEKSIIYCHIVRIISRIICKNISTSRIKYAVETLNKLCSYFKNVLIEDEECYQCFQQFQSLCIVLLTPVENFANDSAKNIQDFLICDKKLAQKYGYKESLIKWNAFNIAEIVEPMFTYWETYIQIDKNKFLDTGIMLETINLIIHLSTFFIKDVSNKCKSCLDENCTVKRDIYNNVILKYRCIYLINKFPAKTLPKTLCVYVGKILEQNVALISEMRECKCKRWTQLWTTCGALIYNMGIIFEHVYEESVHMYTLLCTYIFRFQGIESESNYLSFENPAFITLHRLCAVHYTNEMYREAMTASALNILLTYDTQFRKASDMWVNIKKKCASEEIAKLTVLECLRNDETKISEMGFTIDFSKYDLIQLCLHEARTLVKENIAFANGASAVLQELEKLKPSNRQYTQAIQLLGHYLLGSEYDSSVLKYHKKAISHLSSNSVASLCLKVNLAFFTFIEELHIMNKQTLVEMENTRFALFASKLPEVYETKSPTVVPAYTMLNIKKDSSLMASLQECLEKWNQLIQHNILSEVIENWEPGLVLRILITFGEYCRIYRHEKCEAEAWVLAHRLASKIGDCCTIIYITGRSISLRQINYDWIATAKEYATKYKDSKDENIISAIAIFWISLADFYFHCGKCDEAKKLLNDARNLPGISFFTNTSIYLFSLDVIICNCNLYEDNINHEDYSSYIVESLYAMINLSQNLSTETWKRQAIYLFSYDVLFTATVNLSLRVNHMLSFREISAHLVQRVKSAQSLGAVMRTAELLKSLCYIDLSRTKLDDCEVKLQGLEHMLDIETFQLSMNAKPNSEASAYLAVSPARIVDPVRDVPQRDASPVLGKKVFDMPKFTLHEKCDCYKCKNVSYRYLVFIATYIRAQLYALQCHNKLAFDHFYGALKIRQKLFAEEQTVLPESQSCDETGARRFSWQARSYITDYVQLLIDFSYFLETNVASKQQDASDIANLAISICRKYKLERHPVYISAEEIMLNNAFQTMLKSPNYLDFMVPQMRDIDISKYMRASSDSSTCVTPAIHDRYVKKPASIRRKKNPVILNLDKINMFLSDDEDVDTSSSPVAYSTRESKLTREKTVKRKLLKDDLSDDASSKSESVSIGTKSTKDRTRKDSNTRIKGQSMKDIMCDVVCSIPDIGKNVMDLIEEDAPATMENVNKLIEQMENLKVNSSTTQRTRKVKRTNESTIANYNKNVNQAVELLKNLAMGEKTNKNADNISTPSTSQSKIKQCSSTKLMVNNDVTGVRTRSSLRKSGKKPS
ncbi:uncharacterized protein LOC105184670 isoform X2 [Harpegnathos saltator]|uniref:uncharacterized protein LOC105184670 isoform X2 n=1 Tax=Harpegnathos saltator TaxID=610380 RepID=UPI00058D3395|nr:uncharacterized protein LOC105184670 isoform X2 [Harpegnathos saltator]